MATNIITVTNFVTVFITNAQPSIGVDVVKQVNDFYSTSFGYAFNHICLLLGWLLTILGIAVPAAYYLLQNRQLELKEKSLEKSLGEYLKKEVINLGDSLRKENSSSLKSERDATQQRFNQLEKNVNEELERARGAIFHVQGNTALQAGHYFPALRSFTRAIEHFLKGDMLENVQLTLGIIADKVLTKLNKKDFGDPQYVKELNEALETVRKAEHQNLLKKDIDRLSKALEEAQAR